MCGADWGALAFAVEHCANCRAAQAAFDDLIERAALARFSRRKKKRPRIARNRLFTFSVLVRFQFIALAPLGSRGRAGRDSNAARAR
jgi:hypothetical protein